MAMRLIQARPYTHPRALVLHAATASGICAALYLKKTLMCTRVLFGCKLTCEHLLVAR